MVEGLEKLGYPIVDMPPSAASSPNAAVNFLVGQLVQSGRLRPEHAARVVSQVLHRESQGSTAIGHGVALPHSKTDVVDEIAGVIGKSSLPVVWPGAPDEVPIHTVSLLVTPESQPGPSLRALEAVVRQFRGGAE